MSETSGALQRPDGATLAWRRTSGAGSTVVWLGGFRSDMAGSKAQALADWAAAKGRDYLRFDYFGHGQSSGDFLEGSITRWRTDALAVIDDLTSGPLVLVGSSMGGWLALLAAAARPERIHALVLIAPAADFTETLMKPQFPPEALRALQRDGVWMEPSDYDPAGYPITRLLIEDGARWSVLPGPLGIAAPVRILQGMMDDSVPWTHAQELVAAIQSPDVVFTLVKDGDHRLSRPQDLARLVAAVEEIG
ncbi:MAG: alpha/beta hydrolase [Caulobacteraceae bacterium]|nr:alpha/beta hydrolase [Caulobacteraceae bacterium]